MLAVTSYDISLFLHITAVVIGFGSTFVEALTFPVAMRPGLYQVEDLDLDLGDFWLAGALAIVIVLAGMLGAYFIPEDRRLEAMAARDIAASGSGEVALSDEYRRRMRIEGALGGFASLLVIAAVYLMVTKPAL